MSVPAPSTLRQQVLRGGTYLAVQQGLGAGIALVGGLLLARLIGPGPFGLYAAAFGIASFFSYVALMGIDVYLVRRESQPDAAIYHQAFSFLLVSGPGLGTLGVLASPILELWLGDARFLPPLRAMLLLMPLAVLTSPIVAQLERSLEFRRVAALELTGLLLNYAVAVLFAWYGAGVWAPVTGYGVSQAWLLVGTCALTGYRPCWHWSPPLLREMLPYGLSFSTSIWIWQVRVLVNPLVVGPYLGPDGVGYAALAIRLVDGLSFLKGAAWRLSIAALAKLQGDLPRLRGALEEAMGLQVLALSPLLAGFALLSPWLVPLLFGDRWTPAITVYPFIALGCLVHAMCNMHASVLYVLRHNRDVTIFHVVNVALFAAAALLLVPWLGLLGYGLAELLVLPTYLVLHRQVGKVFAFSYNRAAPWLIAFSPPLFTPLAVWPMALAFWVPVLALPLSRMVRGQVQEYWTFLRGSYA
jgi:O-antigen/teichoic acid export membrane protein